MPTSAISIQRQVGLALADDLSDYTFNGDIDSIDAVYRRRPDYLVEDLGTLKVSVVPGPVSTGRSGPAESTFGGTRGTDWFDVTFGIVIAKHVGSETEMEQLEDLVQEIVDAVRSYRLTLASAPANTKWQDFTVPMPFDPDALADRSIWMTQIEVTYQVAADKLAPTE